MLDKPANEASFRELTGLAGQKPWECVGEILEAAACLYALTQRAEWAEDAIVSALKDDLLNQYGSAKLESAYEDLMVDSAEHLIPADLAERLRRMRFDEPVLLYGAGREARSTRNFIAQQSPGTEGVRDRRQRRGRDRRRRDDRAARPAGGDRGAALRDHRQEPRRVALPADLRAGARGRDRGDLEPQPLGAEYRDRCTVIAISGTKGKSTTATLVHLMLVESGLDAGLAGNVGLAPLEIADKHKIVVFELSSYQTADMAFSPDIAAITNLTPEHTDWHRTVEHYYADKLNLIDRDAPFPVGARRAGAQRHRGCSRPCATSRASCRRWRRSSRTASRRR